MARARKSSSSTPAKKKPIRIKPSEKGTFTADAKKAGKSVQTPTSRPYGCAVKY